MSKYDKIQKLDDVTFKRVVGVKQKTYELMAQEYKAAEAKRKEGHGIGGRKPSLCEEDRVLFMLEYYREYRTLENVE